MNLKDRLQIKKALKALKTPSKERLEMEAKCKNGFAYIEILVPKPSDEDFERWELGESVNCGAVRNIVCGNNKTVVMLLNTMEGALHRIRMEHPEIMLEELRSQMKANMVINEEDLNNNEH